MRLLIGSTFPLTLIRRKVEISPVPVDYLKAKVESAEIYSFWGHGNTLRAANEVLGVDLTPKNKRPALTLNEKNLPLLDGVAFDECWVLSPNYVSGFRPAIGAEVDSSKIIGWDALRVRWTPEEEA